ncbi:MAG: DUF6600 domain-containing protein [Candidatus Acidiferrales bacterium]
MRKRALSLGVLFFAIALVSAFPGSAAAQDQDPPGRVARLNYIQGSVSYQVSGDQDWVQADPNRPLTTGDNLWADKDSRGEVHIGSTAIRMSSETGISFLTLDDRTTQIQLAQGTIEVHLRILQSGDAFEVDTPNLALTLTQAGEYRIETDPNGGSTVIVVREGAGEVTGGGDTWGLGPLQQYTFNGTDQLTYDAGPAPAFDDFEDWCQSRDQRENDAVSAKYVSRDVDGYYDLDDYGSWQSDSDYGEIWVPSGVAVGWSPYQMGHWVFIEPWGWTWVDSEPWGWAPFHYGRWAYVGDRWGWVPGPIVVRPVYAPALVGFVGGGGFGFSVAFGGGFSGVGWFPLGPRDVFVPGYRCSPRYFQNVNVTNTRIVNVTEVRNVYNTAVVNHDVTHVNYMYGNNQRAITAVSRDTFVNARPVNREIVRVNADQIRGARVADTTGPIAPGRTSYVSATARVSTAKPSYSFAQRPVVARLNPAVETQRRTPAYTNDSKPFNQPQNTRVNENGNTQPNPRVTNNPPANNQQESRDGFRPFTPPGSNNRTTAQPDNRNTNQTQVRQNEERPAMKFTQPTRARDNMYDVHPPLNHQQNQSQPQPRQQEQHSAPPSHSESHPQKK